MVVLPTVMAAAVRAGDWVQASRGRPRMSPLPAARAYVTPLAMERSTAASRVELAPPPSDMLATAGLTALAVTQSMPAMTPAVVPLPLQSSTRTATRLTDLATPYVVPPTVPATCVPCPLQSSALPPS